MVFNGPAKCATCHVPPLYTEPGQNLHTPSEIGIDSFQADRSPTHMYCTAPLAGLWTHQKGGFFHDGRFVTLLDVVNHYDMQFNLDLSNAQNNDLIEYLKENMRDRYRLTQPPHHGESQCSSMLSSSSPSAPSEA